MADATATAGTSSTADTGIPNPFNIFPDIFGVLDPTKWLKSAGGAIASGIESAFIAMFKDLWKVIIGPLEMIAGIGLAIIVVIWIFKDDLAGVRLVI